MTKLTTTTAIFFILTTGISVYAQENWVAFEGLDEAPPNLTVVESDENHTVVEITTPGVLVENITEGENTYQTLTIPGYEGNLCGEEGRPELPAITEFIAVPGTKNVTLNVIETQTIILEDYCIYPLQPLCKMCETPPPFTIEGEFYENYDGFYPTEQVDLADPGIWRDIRVVGFSFKPVRFNPASGELEATQYVKFELVYEGESTVNVKEDPDYPIDI